MNAALDEAPVSTVDSSRWPARLDPLTRNGYLLVASTLVTSALGVVFWTLAARRFSTETVGRSAAAIAALVVLGNIAQLNLVNALNRFVPVAGGASRRLILGAYSTVALSAVVVATIFLLGLQWWAPDLAGLRGTAAALVGFPLVVIAWTLFVVEDGALAGMRAAGTVLGSNASYAVAKLAVLLALPASASELGIFWAWSLTLIPVVVVVTRMLWRRLPVAGLVIDGVAPESSPAVSLRTVARFVVGDYSAVVIFTTSQGVVPIALLTLVGPRQTALFSLAWTVAYVPYLAGRAMGMSLLTEAARAPHALATLSWRTLQRGAAVVIPMVAVIVVAAPLVLRVFGEEYAEHAVPLLRLLALAAVPGLVVAVYSAILRARGRHRAQVLLAVSMSAAVLGSLAPATSRFGVAAVGWIWLATHLAVAVVLGLTALRALWVPVMGRGASRLAGLHRSVVHGAVAAARGQVAASTVVSCALGAGGLWLAGVLGGIEWRDMTDVGLISVLPIVWFVAVALLTVGFVTSVFTTLRSDWWWRSCVVLLILALHATPTVVYGTLRYAWAWKHLGVVDFISRNGRVDPTVSDLSVYHGWPGFFSLNAMLDDAVGSLDLSSVAAWWPTLVNLMIVAALQVVGGAFTHDRRVIAVMCWVFVLTSWVGQDYFSPQALAYVMYLVVIGIVLRTLRLQRWVPTDAVLSGSAPDRRSPRRLLSLDRIARPGDGLEAMRTRLRSRVRGITLMTPAVVWLLVVAIASSHQLTPVMLLVTCTLLVVLRYAGGAWLPLIIAAITGGWVLLFARPLLLENNDDVAIGAVAANVSGTLTNLGTVSPGHAFVSLVARILTVLVGTVGIAGWVHGVRHGRAHAGALLLMGAPLLLIAFSAYGDEILFRVYMFALPGAAFYIASLAVSRRRARSAAAVVTVVSVVLVPMFLLAHLGNERMYAFTRQEVDLATALYDSAPMGSLIVEGSRNYPAQSRRYDAFRYVPLDREPPDVRERVVNDPEGELETWLDNPDYTATYVLLTRGMRIETEMLGTMPEDGLLGIERSLRASRRFTVLASNADAVVFTLTRRSVDTPPILLSGEQA